MSLGETFHRRNVARIAAAVTEGGAEALLLLNPANVAYATGYLYAPSARPVASCIWASGAVALFVPYLQADDAALTGLGDIRWYPEQPATPAALEWMLREAGASALLVDELDARGWLAATGVVAGLALDDSVARLRRVKQSEELRVLERAAEYADSAVERLYARLTTGATERELLAGVCGEVDALARREAGADYPALGPAVSGVVLSGPRAALAGGLTSDRRLTRGDLLVASFRVNLGGYYVEAGATFFMGDPLREVVALVETTQHAHDAARAALTVGARAADVDNAAAAVIEAAGHGAALRHRVGHGVGLAPHEPPWLTAGSAEQLAAGMVVALAPGLYVPGRLGVRDTETVVVEADGPRPLTNLSARWRDLTTRLKEF